MWWYVAVIPFTTLAQNLLRKRFAVLTAGQDKSAFVFGFFSAIGSLLVLAASMLFFGLPELHLPSALYGAAFAACYLMSFYFSLFMMKTGTLALTALIMSYSLVIPALYGYLFLKEPVRLPGILGLAFLLFSLYLINRPRQEDGKITWQWAVLAIFAFFSNGLCAVFQKEHQLHFPGLYRYEFTFAAMLLVFLVNAIVVLFMKRADFRAGVRHSLRCGGINGMANTASNFCMISASGTGAASSVYPLISALNIVFIFLASRFLFRERLSRAQLVGFLAGVAAVVLLNL